MGWFVLYVSGRDSIDLRMLGHDSSTTGMIEVDSITIQLTFTKPSLVSAKEMDKIVVTVGKEIFAEHISSIDKD